jgi:hypothetical protein
MFVALVLTVCSAGDPQDCRKQEFLFESHGSLAACMFEAPPWIAAWQEQHPELKVARWKCEFPDVAGKPT